MKKKLLSVASLLLASYSFSQVLFSENFDGAASFPSGWVLHNVDGLTPAANVGYVNNAWVIRPNSGTGQGNHAVSTSWYNPAGTSNDWMVSPSISIPASGSYVLQFDAMAPDPQFPDGFKVYISTTGTAVADFGTTPVLTVNAPPSSYMGYSVDLSAYAGQTIHFAVRNDNTDKFLLFADNFVVRQPQQNDAVLSSASINRYSLTNTNNTLSMNVANNGSNPITSLTVSWNDGAAHSETINVNIPVGGSSNVNHPTPVNYSAAFTRDIEVEITQVNGTNDPAPEDNSGNAIITTLSQSPTKRVVIEEGTGTWCQWCPRGAVAMEYMYNTYPDRFIGIAVHNGDPMTVSEYDNGANFGGYPSANIDRSILDGDVSQADFQNYYNQRKDLLTPASISVNGVRSGNDLEIELNTLFFSQFSSANYRLGVIIIEDGVKGTSSGYNQANAYAGGGYGPMGGYESLPSTVPAAQMVYDHVGRALLGGYNGQAGSVPTEIYDGMPVSYTFNYTVPAAYNIDNMYAVGVIIDNTTGEIINANKSPLKTLSLGSVESVEMNVFPNPATDKINVSFEAKGGDYMIEITDLQGRVVVSEQHTNLSGSQSVELNTSSLKSGNYLVSIAKEGASYTKMISVK